MNVGVVVNVLRRRVSKCLYAALCCGELIDGHWLGMVWKSGRWGVGEGVGIVVGRVIVVVVGVDGVGDGWVVVVVVLIIVADDDDCCCCFSSPFPLPLPFPITSSTMACF